MSEGDMKTVFMIDYLILYHELPLLTNKKIQTEADQLLGACDFSLKRSADVEKDFKNLYHELKQTGEHANNTHNQ